MKKIMLLFLSLFPVILISAINILSYYKFSIVSKIAIMFLVSLLLYFIYTKVISRYFIPFKQKGIIIGMGLGFLVLYFIIFR